jgi:hypothetical protein
MTNYKDCDTKALLIIESGLDYYDPEIMWELSRRADLESLWFTAEDQQDFEAAYRQIIDKLTQ